MRKQIGIVVAYVLLAIMSATVLVGIGLLAWHWHEGKKSAAYEQVLQHGYQCRMGMIQHCTPMEAHENRPPQQE
jgi:hypothetical protein